MISLCKNFNLLITKDQIFSFFNFTEKKVAYTLNEWRPIFSSIVNYSFKASTATEQHTHTHTKQMVVVGGIYNGLYTK